MSHLPNDNSEDKNDHDKGADHHGLDINLQHLTKESQDCVKQFTAKPTSIYIHHEKLFIPPLIPLTVVHEAPQDDSNDM